MPSKRPWRHSLAVMGAGLALFGSLYSQQKVLRAPQIYQSGLENAGFDPVSHGNPQMGAAARHVELPELTISATTLHCPESLLLMKDKNILNATESSTRKIPKIVHATSKSRCLTKPLWDTVNKWIFDDHSFFFHDDEAVERLLQRHWDTFPHLNMVRKCLRSGAATADLWRYLILWEYGGIYTDIDNAPGPLWNSTLIKDDDDAFFVVEHIGVLSQYFMASSPKHPLMFMAIQSALYRLLDLEHVGKQNIPSVTGPGALKVAFKHFMRSHNVKKYGRVTAGRYVGVGNRSVTVVGSKYNSSQYLARAVIQGKGEEYRKMDMIIYSVVPKKKFNESCFVHIWNLEHGNEDVDLSNW